MTAPENLQSHEVSEDMLMALADGEMTGPAADRLRELIRDDLSLAERYAVFAETAALLKSSFGAEPVPDRLIRAVLDTSISEVGNTDSDTPKVIAFPGKRAMIWPIALAASLMLAIGIGGFIAGQSFDGVGTSNDRMQSAAAALATIETGGTVALAEGDTARALGSFETDLGLCRLIAVETPDGASERALSCRSDTGWQVALTVASGQSESYLPAADIATQTIDAFLDEIGAGPALEAEAEAEALAQ